MKTCVLWCVGVYFMVLGFSSQAACAESSVGLYTAPIGTALSIQEVRQLPETHWRPADINHSFGFIPQREAWLRILLGSHLIQPASLIVHRANLQEVCFFSHQTQSCRKTNELADLESLLPAAEPIFSLASLQPEESVIYLRVRSENYVTAPFSIFSQRVLAYQFFLKRLLDFSAMGTFFSLICLNLILAFWLKKSVYALHAGALFSWSIAWFGLLMGYSRFLPAQIHDAVFKQMPFFAITTVLLSTLAYQIFSHHELNPKVRRYLYFMPGLLVLTLVSFLLPIPLLHVVLVRVWALGMIVLVLSGLFWSLVAKKYWSAFYLLCWLSFYSTTAFLVLLQYSLFPFTLLTYSYFSWLQCVSMLALVLLPLLSVERLKHIQDILMMRNLMLALDQRQHLEAKVEERTLALQESVVLLEDANQKLTTLNRSKARLFVILAHDLRTPFLSMLALLNVFERGVMKQTDFLEMLPRLKKHLENVSASLDNMLTWIKAELDGYPHKRRTLGVSELLEEVKGIYQEPARQKQISLQVNSVCPDLYMKADRDHVRLVLRNIVGNALKFTPEGGGIQIWAESQGEAEIVITVQDTGKGFSEADLERFRTREALSSQAGTSGEQGLGLGLQACVAYLEVNQGKLTIEPQSSGLSGSCIHITFHRAMIRH